MSKMELTGVSYYNPSNQAYLIAIVVMDTVTHEMGIEYASSLFPGLKVRPVHSLADAQARLDAMQRRLGKYIVADRPKVFTPQYA